MALSSFRVDLAHETLSLFFGLCYAIYAQAGDFTPPQLEVSSIVIEPHSVKVPRSITDGSIAVQVYNFLVETLPDPTATVALQLMLCNRKPDNGTPPLLLTQSKTQTIGTSPTVFQFVFSVGLDTSPGEYCAEASISTKSKNVNIKVSEDRTSDAAKLTVRP